jgi:hypothetical protein
VGEEEREMNENECGVWMSWDFAVLGRKHQVR